MDAHHYTSRVDGVTLKLAHGEWTRIQPPPATCLLSLDTSLSNEFTCYDACDVANKTSRRPAGEQ